METVVAGVRFDGCVDGHCFHLDCAKECVRRRPQCPVCRRWLAEWIGDMPPGRMLITPEPRIQLRGHEGDGRGSTMGRSGMGCSP